MLKNSNLIHDYQKLHLNQFKILFEKNLNDQLILNQISQQNYYYYPSLLKNKFYTEVKEKLQQKDSNKIKAHQLCWLIIAKAMLKENYLVQKVQLKQRFGEQLIDIVDKWLSLQDQNQQKIQKSLIINISEYRKHFQYLNQKTTKYGYLNLKQVPVYLISTQWLQKFYDDEYQNNIQPIDNRKLIKLMNFINNDPNLIHLNYQVDTKNFKENRDFKIISPECWNFLVEKFSGVEVKRFTTNQNQPSVQISYRKLIVSIVEERYFHMKSLEILVPRFSTFKAILDRIKRLIIAYKLLPFQSLTKTFEFIKIKDMNQEQMIDFVQDQQLDFIEDDQRFQKIDHQIDVQQAKIYAQSQLIIINIFKQKKNDDLFSKVKQMSTIITRQKCLNCGKNNNNIFLCICKSVHFCSDQCQKSHKQHSKQCQKIRKEEMKLAKLLIDYNVTSRQINLTTQKVLNYGKVGLENLRNTCYFNSALQCILRVQMLVKYFANNDHIADINIDNVLGSEGHLACGFGELVKNYFSTNKRALQPIDVLRIIAKNPQFRGSEHQDSQQFLNYFLDKLHQDLNRIKKKPYTQEIQSNGRPDQIVSKQSWQNYLKRNSSFIQQLFTGQYRSQIRCPDCNKISITFDPFMSVTLQFPKPQKYLSFKGYILTIEGQFQKVQASVPQLTKTQLFYEKTFHQKVLAVNVKNKLIKKQWRQDLFIHKNYNDDDTLLFYVKQQGWQTYLDLLFYDLKNEIIGFNRRIYIRFPQTIKQLKQQIYKHMKIPLLKTLKKQFSSDQQYLQFCISQNIIQFSCPSQNDLTFPFIQTSYLLKLQFNPQIKFEKEIKLNTCPKSYQIKSEFFMKDSRQNDSISISEMIENFKIPEMLTEDNMWYCNKCKDHKMAEKIMKIYRTPQILIMHLKRFNHKNTRYKNLIGVEKIQTSIKLNQIEKINNQKYQLIGIVNHFGSMSFGHYTAYVKKDQWVTYDDSKVKKCVPNGDNAYLLFYQRIKAK